MSHAVACPSVDLIVRYVTEGDASSGIDAAVETHLSACDACAAVLAREARLDVMLFEVAAEPGGADGAAAPGAAIVGDRSRGDRRAVFALVAAAAGLLLMLGAVGWLARAPGASDPVNVGAVSPADAGAWPSTPDGDLDPVGRDSSL